MPLADLALPAGASRWPPVRALIGGLGAAAVIGFMFGLRAGAVAGPVVALVLWRGTPAIRLVQLAGGLLGVVVIIYLGFPGENQGGFDNGFTSQHLGAHWVAVGAFVLLALALIRDLTAVSRATRRPPGVPAGRPARPARSRERV